MIRLGANFGVIHPRAFLVDADMGGGGSKNSGYGGGKKPGDGGGGGGFGPGGKSVADMDPKSFGSTVGGMGTNPQGTVKQTTGTQTPEDRVLARNELSIDNQRNVTQAYRDYKGMDDNLLDKIGNLIARAFGFSEVNPTDPTAPNAVGPSAPSVTGKASWALDPIGLALGIGGLANPLVSMAGWAYNGMKAVTGWDGMQIGLDSGTSQPSGQPGGGPALDKGIGRAGNRVGYDQGLSRPTNALTPVAALPAPEDPADPIDGLLDPTGRNRTSTPLVL